MSDYSSMVDLTATVTPSHPIVYKKAASEDSFDIDSSIIGQDYVFETIKKGTKMYEEFNDHSYCKIESTPHKFSGHVQSLLKKSQAHIDIKAI